MCDYTYSYNTSFFYSIIGTEELCVDQLQVLQEDVTNENQPPEKQQSESFF